MPKRKIEFVNGGYYHVYNRGVEKRNIVSDKIDQIRFLRSLNIFNTTEPVGSIFEYDIINDSKKAKKTINKTSRLVEIVAFNLLDNHYHMVLKQLSDKGVSKFIQSVAGGYTKYFNERNDRVGPLFQGPFKAAIVDERMEEIVAYVNLNHVIHKFGTPASKWGVRSSWEQYNKDESIGIVKISRWRKFSSVNSIKIVNEIKKDRVLQEDLEAGVPKDGGELL